MKKVVLLFCLFFMLYAETLFSDATQIGTTSNNFLKINVPARAAAMGEAYTAIGDDIACIFYNPAGLSRSMLGEVAFTHIEWFQQIRYENLSLMMPFTFGNMAIALNYLNVGAMNKTPSTYVYGDYITTINPYGLSGIISYSKEFSENLFIGASLKLLNYAIDPTASSGGSSFSFLLDAGLIYDFSFLNGLSAGVVFKNVGPSATFITQSFMQPMAIRAGAGYSGDIMPPNLKAEVETDMEFVNDNDLNFCLGLGLKLFNTFSLRGGYKGGTINQPTFGAGLAFSGVSIDYALVPYSTDDLGTTHRITLSYKFGSPEVKIKAVPRVFSPNRDKFYDFVFFVPDIMLKNKVSSSTITIYDQFKNPVRTYPVANFAKIYWNGFNGLSRLVADGTYYAALDVLYKNGIKSRSNLAPFELDNTPPKVDGDANPKVIKPGQLTTLVCPVQFTEFAQDLHGIGAWKLIIGTMDGKVFKSFSGQGEPMGVTWEGDDDSGMNTVKTKTNYTYTFYAMDRVGNWGKSQTRQVKVLPKEIIITLAADTLFDIGKADVKISVYKDLQKIADMIKQRGNPKVVVEGHTDNVPVGGQGTYRTNQQLSQARAEAVRKFFIELFGMDPNVFTAVGKGDTVPIAPNDTPEGRKLNRRVTMRIQASEYQ